MIIDLTYKETPVDRVTECMSLKRVYNNHKEEVKESVYISSDY